MFDGFFCYEIIQDTGCCWVGIGGPSTSVIFHIMIKYQNQQMINLSTIIIIMALIRYAQLLQVFSMMINNNPYNLPDRSGQKSGRIYTQTSTAQYRKNDSLDNSQSFTQSSVRNQNNPISPNIMMKKSGINLDEIPSNYRPPIYPGAKNDFKHYLPSPKNQSSSSNISNFSNISSPRNSFNVRSVETQQISSNQSGNTLLTMEMKEIQEKIQMLQYTVKSNQRKINQLQKNNANSSFSLPNNSNIHNDEISNGELITNFMNKIEIETKEEINKIKESISKIRAQISCLNQHEQSDFMATIRKFKEFSKTNDSTIQNLSRKLIKEIQSQKTQLEEKINLNHQFMTSVISRLERQIHNSVSQIPQVYKSSAIKCSGSAILLRFVECFKVRKNTSGNKIGEIKIVLTDNTYYIDNEGFLLDKQQHYLIDGKGNQVRLEDKHVKMLRQQRVLI